MVGFGIETLQFYERRGLLEEPPRCGSGYRRFPDAAIARVCFITRAKELGFSLNEVSELLALRVDSSRTCEDVRARAQEKIEEIDEKLRDLQQVKDALQRLASSCKGQGPSSECPILEALESSP